MIKWKNISNSMYIKNAAVYSHTAHNLLNTVINSKPIGDEMKTMIIPDIIICAFSCELYLKAIIDRVYGKVCEVHRLDELYDLIPSDIQQCIRQETLEGLKTYAPNKKYNFEETLRKNGNIFVDARYFYEKNIDADILFLNILIQVLDHVSKYVFKFNTYKNEG